MVIFRLWQITFWNPKSTKMKWFLIVVGTLAQQKEFLKYFYHIKFSLGWNNTEKYCFLYLTLKNPSVMFLPQFIFVVKLRRCVHIRSGLLQLNIFLTVTKTDFVYARFCKSAQHSRTKVPAVVSASSFHSRLINVFDARRCWQLVRARYLIGARPRSFAVKKAIDIKFSNMTERRCASYKNNWTL